MSRLILLLNKLNDNFDSINIFKNNYDESLKGESNKTLFVKSDNDEEIVNKVKEIEPKVFIDCVGG